MSQDHSLRAISIDPYLRKVREPDNNLENLVANWDRLKSRLTVFYGAGASVGAKDLLGRDFPSAVILRDALWKEFMIKPADRDSFDGRNLGLMTLEHAAAIAEARSGRSSVEEYLVSCFDTQVAMWHHAVLPFLHPKAVFTTNYDELIEKGWKQSSLAAGVPDLVLQHNSGPRSPASRVPLFKPHGTLQSASEEVGKGGLVITMFDYFQMIGAYREMIEQFLSDFRQTCVLFVGYAFMDMDIASELFRLRRGRGIPWYAVFPRSDADVRRMYEEKFGIRQIDRTAAEFLADLDERVNFIPSGWKYETIAGHQSAGRIQ